MKLPLIGIGTWDLRGSECTKVVKEALQLGYHHIDTAHVYENHKAIHKAITGVDRNKLFLTSKFTTEQIDLAKVNASVEKACDLALQELGAEYLDLYLLHWPEPKTPLDKIFKAMEKLVQKGKVKRAGVSNCTIHHLQDLLQAGCKPAANQVEFHPYLFQKDLWNFCRSHQIELISYRPLGQGALLKEPLFKQIGLRYEKSPAQVILRWLVQHQIPTIPKASSKRHLIENLAIFDFALTAAEMKEIEKLNKNRRFCKSDEPIFDY